MTCVYDTFVIVASRGERYVYTKVASAALDLVLVFSAVVGTRAGRGPLIALLAEHNNEREIFLCIQVMCKSDKLRYGGENVNEAPQADVRQRRQ